MTAPMISILEAIADPELLARWFRNPQTWRAWFVLWALTAFARSTNDGLIMTGSAVCRTRSCPAKAEHP
jgi:uncharacterized protein YndB with AHSA1/START domain